MQIHANSAERHELRLSFLKGCFSAYPLKWWCSSGPGSAPSPLGAGLQWSCWGCPSRSSAGPPCGRESPTDCWCPLLCCWSESGQQWLALRAERPSHRYLMRLSCAVRMLTVSNLHVMYLQPVKANVTAEGVVDSSHRPVNLIQFLSESAQLPGGLPGRDGIDWVKQLQFPERGTAGFVDVHLSWTSWVWSQVEVRDTSEIKLDMFLSAELLREDSLSSSCTR